MARTVEQIERDLSGLKQAVQAIAHRFEEGYARYLDHLGPAVRQQLILVSYYLCTQGYPERFLKRSLSQRQELQQALLTLARKTQADLSASLHDSPPDAAEVTLTGDDSDRAVDLLDLNELSDVDDLPDLAEVMTVEDDVDDADGEVVIALPLDQVETPEQLINWLERREEAIAETLDESSQSANHLLQRSHVLLGKLPESILDAAAKAGLATESTTSIPNLLNLLVELDSDDDDSSSAVTHIMAIKLRLSEIEFADANLSSLRIGLRELSAHLGQLKREFQKRQQELAIAQAEAAWRSSWYE